MSGLAEQMLAIVVGNEVPELENQRQELIRRMSEGRLMLKVQSFTCASHFPSSMKQRSMSWRRPRGTRACSNWRTHYYMSSLTLRVAP